MSTLTPLSQEAIFQHFSKGKRSILKSRIPSFRAIRVPEVFDYISIQASFGDYVKISLDPGSKNVILFKWKNSKTKIRMLSFSSGQTQSTNLSDLSPCQLLENWIENKLNKPGNLIKFLEGGGWLLDVLNRLKPKATFQWMRIVNKGGSDLYWVDRVFGRGEGEVEEEHEQEQEENEESSSNEDDDDFSELTLPSCSLHPDTLLKFKNLQNLEYFCDHLDKQILDIIMKLKLRELRLAASSFPDNRQLLLNSRSIFIWERKNSIDFFILFAKRLANCAYQSPSGYGLCETDNISTDQFFNRVQIEFPKAKKPSESEWSTVKRAQRNDESLMVSVDEKSALLFFISGGYRVELIIF